MSRPVDRYNSAELFALADKLDKQGLFAAIDIQDSRKDGDTVENGSRMGKLNDVISDAIRFVADWKDIQEQHLKNFRMLDPNTPPQVGME